MGRRVVYAMPTADAAGYLTADEVRTARMGLAAAAPTRAAASPHLHRARAPAANVLVGDTSGAHGRPHHVLRRCGRVEDHHRRRPHGHDELRRVGAGRAGPSDDWVAQDTAAIAQRPPRRNNAPPLANPRYGSPSPSEGRAGVYPKLDNKSLTISKIGRPRLVTGSARTADGHDPLRRSPGRRRDFRRFHHRPGV
jgi:hypothetical protein